jgi:hypothetical protein
MKALVLILLAGAMSATSGSARTIAPSASESESPQPRTDLTCAWTMFRAAAETGRRCRVPHNAGFQAELEDSVSRIETRARQSWPAVGAQMADRGRRIAGTARARLCTRAALSAYRDMTQGEPEAMRDETDRVIALPGHPQWGTCR